MNRDESLILLVALLLLLATLWLVSAVKFCRDRTPDRFLLAATRPTPRGVLELCQDGAALTGLVPSKE